MPTEVHGLAIVILPKLWIMKLFDEDSLSEHNRDISCRM